MAQFTKYEHQGLRVEFDPLVHRGTIHMHPEDFTPEFATVETAEVEPEVVEEQHEG